MRLQATRDAILRHLLAQSGKEGVRLKDLTAALRLSNAAVLSHLGVLQEEGLVEGKREGPWGRGTRYWPRPAFHALWIDSTARRPRQWSSRTAIDWRFPLVSRVRDAKAQEFLCKWLDLLQFKGVLPRMRSKFYREASPPAFVEVLVYGSCARGDANARSDLDILIYTDSSKRPVQAMVDLAHEASLGAGRSPDVRILGPKQWKGADPAFRANIRAEGITVFSNDPNAPFLEDTTEDAM